MPAPAAPGGAFSAGMRVPADRVGALIGPKGATRRCIELDFGVDLTITAAAGGEGEVLCRGHSQAQVDQAMAAARAFVRDTGGAPPAASSTLVVPDIARGAIIGKGGSSIRVLQAVTGCRILVAESDAPTATTAVTVEGASDETVARGAACLAAVVARERLRIEIKNRALNAGAALSPHVHRIIAVPSTANIGAICGREWINLSQVQLQAGCFIRML